MDDDPRAKTDRADVHVSDLANRVVAFANKAYRVHMEQDFWSEPDPQGLVIIWAEADRDPPLLEWGPIIGDIVHGYRSALDQLVWGLSVDYQATLGVAPPRGRIPYGNAWRKIGFPICLGSDAWKSAKTAQLWAIDPAHLAVLKGLQPFETGKNAPEREPLAVLQELWNIDKHRHLHLVNATVELTDVLTVNPFPDLADPHGLMDVEFEIVSKRAPGPLEGRTEIGRARMVRKPGGLIAVNFPQMHMNPSMAIDPSFDQGYPAYGGRVLHTLSEIGKTVEAILAALA
jgi:hypothetical protein